MTAAASSESTATSVVWESGQLVMTRVYQAPRALVFRAWTEAEHFAQWFGPRGASLPFCRLDPRPGGALHYQHHFADYPDVWVGGVYDQVDAPERIAFTCWFSDPEGRRVPRPGFPAEMRIAVTLAEHPEGTRVTIRQEGLVTDQGEVQGWTESLDRLAEHLKQS
jgi:uncharacterized protein YndB with AHSA1/START domain